MINDKTTTTSTSRSEKEKVNYKLFLCKKNSLVYCDMNYFILWFNGQEKLERVREITKSEEMEWKIIIKTIICQLNYIDTDISRSKSLIKSFNNFKEKKKN